MRNKRDPRILLLVGSILLVTPPSAFADAGLPMIILTFPAMLFALIPIILIEAAFFALVLRVNYLYATLPSFVANAVSTIVGIPLSWFLMFAIESGTGSVNIETIYGKILSVTLKGAWLLPYESDIWWMAPLAAAFGLIPAYAISVFIEYWIVKKFFKKEDKKSVRNSVVIANRATYAILFALCIGLFLFQVPWHIKK